MKTMYMRASASDDERLGFEVNQLRKMAQKLGKIMSFSDVMDAYQEAAVELDTFNGERRKRKQGSDRLVLATSVAAEVIKQNKFIDWNIDSNYMSADPAVADEEIDQYGPSDALLDVNAASRNRGRRPHDPSTDIPQEQFTKLSRATRQGWVHEDMSLRKEVISTIRDDGKSSPIDTAVDMPVWKRRNPTTNGHQLSISSTALQDFFAVNQIKSKQDLREFHSYVSSMSSSAGTSTNNSGENRFKICEVNNASSNNDESAPSGAISKILKAKKGTTLSLTDNDKIVKKITVNNIDFSNDKDDDDTEDEDSPAFPSPPLRTPFGTKSSRQAMYVENDRREIPYQPAGALSSARRFDSSSMSSSSMNVSTYIVSSGKVSNAGHPLIDNGTNGYVCGKDARRMDEPHHSDRKVNTTGVGKHQITEKRIGRFCAVSKCNKKSYGGRRLFIYHEAADVPEQETTIHLVIQLRDYKNTVDDVATCFGGSRSITTPTGEIFPLQMHKGLLYLPQRLPTDWEMENLPQVIMTLDKVWDPSKYSTKFSIEE